ncbi:hypothetical protein AB7813_00800 [Tardiphaga sp. 20_F10_N6_6]|uniref:hypothetical protein n=1 Tax=unclassified Tardiphaga TaxID=2631404 RepID=UPI003F22E568
MPADTANRGLDAAYYFFSLIVTLFCFVVSIGYIILAISVNAGRSSDLAGIEASIQNSAAQLAKNPASDDVPYIRAALSDLNAQRVGQQKEIDYGKDKLWHLTFRECALAFDSACFHRNSSAMNIIYLGIASGVLGVCLFFFISMRTDALLPAPAMWQLSTLISLICLLPIGSAIGLLTVFILRGAKGAILTQVSNVVQVESPFGIAFACTLAAFFSDRILAALSRLLEHFGLTKTA